MTGGAFVNSSEALFQAGLKVDGGERLLLMDAVLPPHWREASDFIQHPSLEIDVIEQRPRGT